MTQEMRIIGVSGLPEVAEGDDLAALIFEAALGQSTPLEAGDVVVVTQKIVSKAEGAVVDLRDVTPSPLAEEFARQWDKDPRHVEVVLRETKRVVRMERGVLIVETKHGFVCANAGVDASNVPGEERLSLLPRTRTSPRTVSEAASWSALAFRWPLSYPIPSAGPGGWAPPTWQ